MVCNLHLGIANPTIISPSFIQTPRTPRLVPLSLSLGSNGRVVEGVIEVIEDGVAFETSINVFAESALAVLGANDAGMEAFAIFLETS